MAGFLYLSFRFAAFGGEFLLYHNYVVDKDEYGRKCPAERIAYKDIHYVSVQRHGYGQPYLPQNYHAQKGEHHDGPRFSEASYGVGIDLVQSLEIVEGYHDMYHADAVLYGGLVGGEYACEELGKEIDRYAHDRHAYAAQNEAGSYALEGSFCLARAVVLADKGGCGKADGLSNHAGKLVDLLCGARARHGGRAEGVDVALDKEVGYGYKARLYGGRYAQIYDLHKKILLYSEVFDDQFIYIVCPHHLSEYQKDRESLGKYGGEGGARDTHGNYHDKEYIGKNICYAGDDKVVKGAFRIAHSP